MKKTLTFLVFTTVIISKVKAQSYVDDALRYSQYNIMGTARIQAIGGAQTALGGDIGAFGINPAGLGFYRKNDFAASAQLGFDNTSSLYFGSNNSNNKTTFSLPGVGVAFAHAKTGDTGFTNNWLGYTFGVALNRSNDFNSNYTFSGQNPTSSMTTSFADMAYRNGLSDQGTTATLADMAYDTFLIDAISTPQGPSYAGLSENGNVKQFKNQRTSGATNQIDISFAGNYGNRLFLGASLGVHTLHYKRDFLYNESDINDPGFNPIDANGNPVNVNNWNYNDYLLNDGNGIDVKLGAILRANEMLRFGFSFHSPIWYNIREEYNSAITSNDQNNLLYSSNINGIGYEYNLRTPIRLNGGAAVFFSKNGFISADIDYLDYSTIKYSSNDATFDQVINTSISDRYKSAVNMRIGAEYKLDQISLRAGYANYGTPYQDYKSNNQFFTGGVGYRQDNFYVDLTGVYKTLNQTVSPYTAITSSGADISPTANINNKHFNIMLTVGTRF
ncbi:OmpP1/FadL family transporter [Solitalea koreensis]|nr:hypothetical protein [Solitalea koreensis]